MRKWAVLTNKKWNIIQNKKNLKKRFEVNSDNHNKVDQKAHTHLFIYYY